MAAAITASDTLQDRLSKVLPADVTAAFLSADQAFKASFAGDPFQSAGPIFWTFIAILALCPFYFRYVTGVKRPIHIAFLCASFTVFAIAIASNAFQTYARGLVPGTAGQAIASAINILAIGLPIVWAFIISNIFIHWIGDRIDSPTS